MAVVKSELVDRVVGVGVPVITTAPRRTTLPLAIHLVKHTNTLYLFTGYEVPQDTTILRGEDGKQIRLSYFEFFRET